MKSNQERIVESLSAVLEEVDLKEKKNHLSKALTIIDGDKELSNLTLRDNICHSLDSRGVERIDYYARKAMDSIRMPKVNSVNDLDLSRWKDYPEILTDSLWNLEKRDRSGGHDASYWGNFIPQIPRQLMLRYTKKGDYVIDPFLGGGTSALEALRMERNIIGMDINPAALETAMKKCEMALKENNNHSRVHFHNFNSVLVDFKSILEKDGVENVKLAILHPPYHDIIKFSNIDGDLSSSPSRDEFISSIGKVAKNCRDVLEEGGYLALVIGDKYERGEWVPLGFLSMNEILTNGFSLKSIVVKNYDATKGKRGSEELWRYRALAGGYYVFKHEYIFIFRKH